MLSEKALAEFKAIWKSETGEDISDQDATAAAINLLTMFDTVYRPVKKEWLNELDEKEKREAA